MPSDRKWPLEALLALVRPELDAHPVFTNGEAYGATDRRIAQALGVHHRTWVRWKAEPGKLLTEAQADELAVATGRHPSEVWPELLDAQIAAHEIECAADDCTVRFVPPTTRRRFCSPRCQGRTASRRRYNSDPTVRQTVLERNRIYYAECADYLKAQERRRYWADPEAARARKRRQTEAA